MVDYQKMYIMLFNAVTDAISIMKKVQQATEELYMSVEEPAITVLGKPDINNNNDEDINCF